MRTIFLITVVLVFVLPSSYGCKSDGNDADRVGVAAECNAELACATYQLADASPTPLTCLTEFSGGYCGIEGCTSSLECPVGSHCVAHTNGINYCFRSCLDKSECNQNRTPENEANCSANFVFATPSDDDGSKACIPPSSGL